MGKDKKTTIITSFIYANFSYFPLVTSSLLKNLKTFKNVALGLNLMTIKAIM